MFITVQLTSLCTNIHSHLLMLLGVHTYISFIFWLFVYYESNKSISDATAVTNFSAQDTNITGTDIYTISWIYVILLFPVVNDLQILSCDRCSQNPYIRKKEYASSSRCNYVV